MCYNYTVGIPSVAQFSFDTDEQVLICTSINGPATNVTWRRNKVKLTTDEVKYRQIQTISNKIESRYVSRLYIRTADPKDVTGNYSCTVSNSRGYDTQSLEIRGKGLTINCLYDVYYCHDSYYYDYRY